MPMPRLSGHSRARLRRSRRSRAALLCRLPAHSGRFGAPSSFGQGAEYLKKAIDLGYTDEEGNIYYYLFHCYYGLKNVSQDNVMLAKDALITGVGKFPKNERILDGLMQLYTAEEGVGDPADLVTLIDSAIADNPRT